MKEYLVSINISYETTANSKEEALSIIMLDILSNLNDGIAIEEIADVDIELLREEDCNGDLHVPTPCRYLPTDAREDTVCYCACSS